MNKIDITAYECVQITGIITGLEETADPEVHDMRLALEWLYHKALGTRATFVGRCAQRVRDTSPPFRLRPHLAALSECYVQSGWN